jgi:DNA invertase Pin-like site-specific DNA recombinase
MKIKQKVYWAVARVSGREQKREGFSLEVQEDGFKAYCARNNAIIDTSRFWKIAETATRSEERKVFKEVMALAKKHAGEFDGILFYKVDRSARNLKDYVALEALETDYNVPIISITQPTENTPAGRMMRRNLAVMASYYTEQQSVDVREGHAKRVQQGLFVGTAPYGYRNHRVDGRGLVEIHPDEAWKIQLIYKWYAFENLTVDGIVRRLEREGVTYGPSVPKWCPSKVHVILRDRAYIGEIRYHGQWYPGKQKPLVDRITWDRVQVLLGDKIYKSNDLAYAGELIRCTHCGSCITGEAVVKKATGKRYIYYRCVKYKQPGHPSIRLTEAQVEEQIISLFRQMKQPADISSWFSRMLMIWMTDKHKEARERAADLERQIDAVRRQEERLLQMRLADEITGETYVEKSTGMRDRMAQLKLQVDAADRGIDEKSELAVKAFELSQSLEEKWLTAEAPEKRKILEILCLNLELDGVSLVFTMRKPFDLVLEGLVFENNRGDRIRTF